MLPSTPQPLGYQPSDPTSATPRAWVICVLLLLLIAGIISGQNLWPLFSAGKDPQIELFWAHLAGCVIFVILCVVYRKRLARFHALDALFTFVLGALSSIAGMVWAVLSR